jgi:hypothetical protein
MWCALWFPSTTVAIHGELGTKLHHWSDMLNAWTDEKLGHWIGQGGAIVAGVLLTIIAVQAARRAFAKSKDSTVAGVGGSAGSARGFMRAGR